jgi:predicted O-methyltransferase YrrM
MMPSDLDTLFGSIGITRDYATADFSGLDVDMQGWGSEHAMFHEAIRLSRPKTIIEVGTWKGASACNMLKICQNAGLKAEIICIDTWLGSNASLWIDESYRKSLRLQHGYPTIFWQFVYNMISAGVMESVYPLPMTSSAAFHLLRRFGLQADLIYIDAGHEHSEVYGDLALYYDLLRPGGVMFGDDYSDVWPGVVAATNRFVAEKHVVLTALHGKFLFTKPH